MNSKTWHLLHYWLQKASFCAMWQLSQRPLKTRMMTWSEMTSKSMFLIMKKVLTCPRRRVSRPFLKRCAKLSESWTKRLTDTKGHSNAYSTGVDAHLPRAATWQFIWESTQVTSHIHVLTVPRCSPRVVFLAAILKMSTKITIRWQKWQSRFKTIPALVKTQRS